MKTEVNVLHTWVTIDYFGYLGYIGPLGQHLISKNFDFD